MSITIILVIITSLISYQAFNNRELFGKLKHHPYSSDKNKEWYRLLTSGFVHGDFVHLIFNMYVLYIFGEMIENVFISIHGELMGRMAFLLLYILSIVIASIPSQIKHKDNPYYSAIGASGAVSAILFAFILFAPWSWLELFFVIPIPAIVFGVLYLAYSSWAINNAKDNIGHSAHFTGAIAGVLLTIAIYPEIISLFAERVMDVQGPGR